MTPDPSQTGLLYEYRKMPLLSTQFVKNAVFQAGVPVTIWGSAIHDWGYEAKGKAEIKFSFAGIEEDHPGHPRHEGMAGHRAADGGQPEPKTLKVVFTIDGELVHERVVKNIVVGDVWYVASPDLPAPPAAATPGVQAAGGGVVRVMTRRPTARAVPGHPVSVCASPQHPKTRMPPGGTTRRPTRPESWDAGLPPRPASRWGLSSCKARRQGRR